MQNSVSLHMAEQSHCWWTTNLCGTTFCMREQCRLHWHLPWNWLQLYSPLLHQHLSLHRTCAARTTSARSLAPRHTHITFTFNRPSHHYHHYAEERASPFDSCKHTHTRAPTSEVFQLTGGSVNSAAAAALVVAEEVALVTVQQCQRVATVQVTTRMNPWRRSALNPTQY